MPALPREDFLALLKRDANGLSKQQREIQRAGRLERVDRWLRACIPERVVKRMCGKHFNVGNTAATNLVREVYREWNIQALEYEAEPVEMRRHRDRVRVEAVIAQALKGKAKDLNAALRGMELLCRINGTMRPDRVEVDLSGLPPEVMSLRALTPEQLDDIAQGRVVEIPFTPQAPALPAP